PDVVHAAAVAPIKPSRSASRIAFMALSLSRRVLPAGETNGRASLFTALGRPDRTHRLGQARRELPLVSLPDLGRPLSLAQIASLEDTDRGSLQRAGARRPRRDRELPELPRARVSRPGELAVGSAHERLRRRVLPRQPLGERVIVVACALTFLL